jgi:hypothetical protein
MMLRRHLDTEAHVSSTRTSGLASVQARRQASGAPASRRTTRDCRQPWPRAADRPSQDGSAQPSRLDSRPPTAPPSSRPGDRTRVGPLVIDRLPDRATGTEHSPLDNDESARDAGEPAVAALAGVASPSELAAHIRDVPGDIDPVVEAAHRRFGNSFVAEAMALMNRKSSRYPVLRRARGGGTRPRLSGQGCAAAGSAGAAAAAVAAGAAAAAAAKSQGSSVSPRSAAITAAARYWAGSRRCSLAVSRIV